jgi:ABC-type uncharacterized transport system substrate-binding protein
MLERLPALAAELARLPVDVIVAPTNPSIAAAMQATRTIPIVMVHVAGPVENGLVASLAHPGGNVTGLSIAAGNEIVGERLQMLKEIVPSRLANRQTRRIVEALKRAAAQTDRILKGARPADVPFELPTRFRLTLNLKTASALGLSIPAAIVLRADRVIE